MGQSTQLRVLGEAKVSTLAILHQNLPDRQTSLRLEVRPKKQISELCEEEKYSEAFSVDLKALS